MAHRNQPERTYSNQGWSNMSNKINNRVLDSYSKHKTNTHESILI